MSDTEIAEPIPSPPITICSFLWFDPDQEYNAEYVYSADDVRLMKRMWDRNLTVPHEWVCVTNLPEQFTPDDGIRLVPFEKSLLLPNGRFPRVMMFHPDAAALIGDRIIAPDMDCVVTGNLDAIVSRPEPVVLWRNPARVPWSNPPIGSKSYRRDWYNTSLVMVTAGWRPDVWTTFSPEKTRDEQTWISSRMGPNAAYWDQSHGVYRLAREDTPGSGIERDLPENARLVFFAGSRHKPWLPEIQERCPWIAEFRR